MVVQGDYVECVKYLLQYKVFVDDVILDYLIVFYVVVYCGYYCVIKFFLDKRVNLNVRVLNGFILLYIVCKKNCIKVMELLVKYGVLI